MFPLNPLACWQEFAQSAVASGFRFASNRGKSNDGSSSAVLRLSALSSSNCYPFPSDWPGPKKAGPLFRTRYQRRIADALTICGIYFPSLINSLKSNAIKTNNRGRNTCVKQSLFFPFSPCRWLAACKIPRRAGCLARPLARGWRMLLAATFLQARLLAALAGLQLVASIWACLPATDLIAAPRGRQFFHDGQPGVAPGWPFLHLL